MTAGKQDKNKGTCNSDQTPDWARFSITTKVAERRPLLAILSDCCQSSSPLFPVPRKQRGKAAIVKFLPLPKSIQLRMDLYFLVPQVTRHSPKAVRIM